MRWYSLHLLAWSLSMLAACSEAKPQGGGQTGDPGVSDFTSLDPDPNPTAPGIPGGGSCAGAVHDLHSAARRYPPYGQPPSVALDSEHVLFLEEARGLAVVDVSAPEPRLVGRVPMPSGIGELHVSGRHAIVSRRSPKPQAAYYAQNDYPEIPEGAELLVIDLSDVTQPRVTERLALEHAQRASYLVEGGGTTRVYVLSDGGAPGGCAGPDWRARLTSYELRGERLVALAELDLGEVDRQQGPMTVAQAGSDLVAVRRRDGGQHLSVISLSSPTGEMTESASIPLEGHVFDVRVAGPDVLRVITDSSTRELRVDRYDIRDRSALVRQRTCDAPIAGGAWADIGYGAHRTFLVSGAGSNRTNTLVSVADALEGSCDVRVTPGVSRSAAPIAGPPGRVFEIDLDAAGNIRVTLRDELDLRVLAEASARPDAGPVNIGFGATVLRDPGASPDGEEGVLAVLFSAAGSDDSSDPSLQLFSFTADSVRARGALLGAGSALAAAEPHALVWSPWRGLGRVDLTDLDAPTLAGRLDLASQFSRVWSYDGHWVRLHTAIDAEQYEQPGDDESFPATARLEIVPDAEDPDLGAASASLDVDPRERFVRAGDLLVSVLSRTGSGPQPARIAIYDLHDPAQPRRAGVLDVPSLWLPDNVDRRLGNYWGDQRRGRRCLECRSADLDAPVLVVPGALVFRSLDQAGTPVLQVLDLSDPQAPNLSEPIAPGSGARPLSAFAHGSSVYDVYRARARGAADRGDLARARFYFRRIDLSRPSQPALGEPINVPGQLVAVDGEDLFTREFVRRGSGFETVLHRLVLRDGRAQLRATHSFGGRMVFALQTDGRGHVLADLGEALADFLFEPFYAPQPTDLRVLEATTLERLGQVRVGPYGQRVDVHAGRALYSAAEGYVLLDLEDPTAPEFRRYFGLLDSYAPLRAQRVGDNVIIQDRGALKRFDATER
jgi:hypothetical protein